VKHGALLDLGHDPLVGFLGNPVDLRLGLLGTATPPKPLTIPDVTPRSLSPEGRISRTDVSPARTMAMVAATAPSSWSETITELSVTLVSCKTPMSRETSLSSLLVGKRGIPLFATGRAGSPGAVPSLFNWIDSEELAKIEQG